MTDTPRRADGVREPDPTLGKNYQPAAVEPVPAPPVEQPSEPAKPPKRQRVVLADPRSSRRTTPTLRARLELEQQTSWGELLIRDLVKHQLRTALGLGVLVLLVLGVLPLAFYVWPGFADLRVVGVPLAWLLLGLLPFPLLLLAGLAHNRLAERNERDFVDMIES